MVGIGWQDKSVLKGQLHDCFSDATIRVLSTAGLAGEE
jgi:hypothetical protein